MKPPYNRAMKSGDENLWFCSEDRTTWGQSPAHGLGAGPFVTRDAHDRMAALSDLVTDRISLEDAGIVSMFHLERGELEPGAIEGGVALLRDCITCEGQLFSLHRQLRLGRDLWLEMLEKREKEDKEDETGTGEEETEVERKLTAEDVFSRLRWTVADVALLERRYRWFRLLAWSTVAWKPPSSESGECRYIVVRNGGVVRSGSGVPEDSVPPPLDRSLPVRTRTGYEALRVLTGELRRVLASGSDILSAPPDGKEARGRNARPAAADGVTRRDPGALPLRHPSRFRHAGKAPHVQAQTRTRFLEELPGCSPAGAPR